MYILVKKYLWRHSEKKYHGRRKNIRAHIANRLRALKALRNIADKKEWDMLKGHYIEVSHIPIRRKVLPDNSTNTHSK